MRTLIILAAFLFTQSCRKDPAPRVDVCLGDGAGGADCTLKDGSHAYRSPSQLENYWMTPQADMARYASWCHDTTPAVVKPVMKAISKEIAANR
jgi:hypothetical protein